MKNWIKNYKNFVYEYFSSNRSPESEAKLIKELSQNGELLRFDEVISSHALQEDFKEFRNSMKELETLNFPAILIEHLCRIFSDRRIAIQTGVKDFEFFKQCIEEDFEARIAKFMLAASYDELYLFFSNALNSPDRLNVILKIFSVLFKDEQTFKHRRDDCLKALREVAKAKNARVGWLKRFISYLKRGA